MNMEDYAEQVPGAREHLAPTSPIHQGFCFPAV